MKVKINESLTFWNGYYVTVETRTGDRFEAYYTTKPTEEEVKEDFRENKSSFNRIN
jgi:hypothetical protein